MERGFPSVANWSSAAGSRSNAAGTEFDIAEKRKLDAKVFPFMRGSGSVLSTNSTAVTLTGL
jgi:hypothetical protein